MQTIVPGTASPSVSLGYAVLPTYGHIPREFMLTPAPHWESTGSPVVPTEQFFVEWPCNSSGSFNEVRADGCPQRTRDGRISAKEIGEPQIHSWITGSPTTNLLHFRARFVAFC